jgi:hypothetical protein
VREYLDELIDQNRDSLVIVTGDLNDGPGIDYFEKYYMTHNTTDILLGSTYYPNLLFKHSFLDRVSERQRYTAIFDDFIDNIQNRPLLLDHILVSPGFTYIQDSGIAHKEYDEGTDSSAQGRQKYVSDHRPVYIDFII